MKISEIAKKAKEKLIGVFSDSRREESGQETPEMTAQKAQEGQQDEKTGISSGNDGKGKETAKNEAAEGKEERAANGNDGFRPDFCVIDEFQAYRSEEIERAMEQIQNIQEKTGMDRNEITGIVQRVATGRGISKGMAAAQFEAVIEAGEELKKAFSELTKVLAEALSPTIKDLTEMWSKMGKTETQIRKEELWKRHYEEKAKMSNNERRRRGIPMVRRPKRQQYRTKKTNPAAAGSRKNLKRWCNWYAAGFRQAAGKIREKSDSGSNGDRTADPAEPDSS